MKNKIVDKIVKPVYHATFRPLVWNARKMKWFLYSKKQISIRKEISKENIKKDKKIRVLFIMQYPEMWGSERTVYETMKEDNRFQVEILAIPKSGGVNPKIKSFESKNEALDYCKKEGISAINAFSNGKWLDLSSMKSDYIFLQRPYDECMPDEYEMSKLMKHGLLCYIPYSGHITQGVHLKIEFNHILLRYLYLFFADSSHTAEYVRLRSGKELSSKTRKIFEFGFPRFDLIKRLGEQPEQNEINVLWTPRWSADDSNDRSYFLDYYETMMDYFKNHRELNLVIRPHPLMFTNFVEKKVLSEQDVSEIKKRVANEPNISFDENLDYNISFRKSTFLVSDISSLLLEYFITGKPIVFCGEIRDFTTDGVKMADQFYSVKDKEQLVKQLDLLSSGNDPGLNERNEIIKQVFQVDGKAGLRIAEAVYQDAQELIR